MPTSGMYVTWNKALVDYFITASTSTVFFVTDTKINDIGQKYDIDKREDEEYVDCFIRTISFFVERGQNARPNAMGRICYRELRNSLFSQLQIEGYCAPIGDRSKDYLLFSEFGENDKTVMDLAVFLTRHKILTDLRTKEELKYPYFPYVVFVLLGFNQSENREWCGVENIFRNKGIYFCDDDRQKVAQLFIKLIDQNVLTPTCVRTQDTHIKYLKYHSVLKPGGQMLFYNILYQHHIQWDTHMVYGDMRNLIWRVGIRNIIEHEELRQALLDVNTRPYFEYLIKNFDREKYALQVANEANEGRGEPIKRGIFRYVIDCITCSPQIWLQYIKPDCAVSTDGITLTPIYAYADNFRADVQDVNRIAWTAYASNGLSYSDANYSVRSRPSDLYFFEIIEGRLLAEMIEPEQLAGEPCYLIVSSEKENKKKIIDHHQAQLIDIRQLFASYNGWEAYYVPQYVPKQAATEMPDTTENNSLRYAQVCFENCITTDRRVYLLEAFPYIVTEGIENPSTEVEIAISDIDNNNVPFEKKVVGNRIFLHDFGGVPCGEIKIAITLDGVPETRSYRIDSNGQNSQEPLENNRTCVRFDKWGCLNNDLNDNYYSDNAVTPSGAIRQNNNNNTPGYIKNKKQPYHRLMSILYALGNSSARNYIFSSNDLDNVINYLADFEGETLTQKEIKRLKYALRDLGILTHYYKNGQYVYEANTPRLIPLNSRRIKFENKLTRDFKELYLLYGAYSQSMYDKLYCAVDHIEYKPIEISDKLDKYLPNYIVVGLSQDQTIPSIQRCNNSLFDDLINFAGNISEIEQDQNVFLTENYADDRTYDYPVIIPANRIGGRTEMLRLSATEVLNNDDLSPDLLRTYIRYKHDEPVWYVDNNRRRNSELYFRSEWPLPFYVRKALVAKNFALPKYLYAFGMEGMFGTERLFCKMYMYKCDDTDNRSRLQDILGGTAPRNFESETIAAYGLRMYAIRSIENDLVNWQLRLYLNDRLLCYTKRDKVFYCCNGQYIEITSDRDGCGTTNAKLSAVLNLHIYCAENRHDINTWMGHYLLTNRQNTDTPPTKNNGEKHEVKIIKRSEA